MQKVRCHDHTEVDMGSRVEDLARELDIAHEPYVRATVVWTRPPSSGSPGDRAIVRPDGSIHGWVGGACAEPVVSIEARDVLESGIPRLIFLGPPGESGRPDVRMAVMSCASEGALEIFMEPVIPQLHVVIVGSSPAVAKLARLLVVMEWDVTIVDEEGKGGDLLTDLPVVSQFADIDVNAASAIIVATHGHYDEDALEWALKTDASYIGLVASDRRATALLDYLRTMSASEEQIARIHAPTGIDLGRVDHEEIAVSILAQLVADRVAGVLRPRGVGYVAPPLSIAVDPVCGMSVEIEGARFTHQHDDQTVYFCCPACRKMFIDDPTTYAST